MAWAAATLPRQPTTVQFRWRYRDDHVRYAGRGVARIAPPDSLRVDLRGPFGYSGAAAMVGDSVLWAEPQGDFRALIGGLPLLWAALGAVQPPPATARVYTQAPATGARTVWRFVTVADTLDYVVSRAPDFRLEAEWRQGGKTRARSSTAFGAEGLPASARIDFPEAPARFELTVVGRDTATAFSGDLWRAR